MNSILSRAPFFAAAALLTTGVFMMTPNAAHAQTPINPLLPGQGTKEVSLSGDLIFQPGSSQDVTVGYGDYLSRAIEVGVDGEYLNPDHAKSSYNVAAFANYNFPGASPLEPFVGVNLGYTDPGAGNGSAIYGVQGGAKYFLNTNVSLNGQLEYRAFAHSGYSDDFRLAFGVSAYLH